jgi:hypothetical protein
METLPAPPVSSRKWYEIWRDVWTNPGVEAFWSILKERDHSATRGFIWIGVTSLILGLAGAITSIPVLQSTNSQLPGWINSGGSIVTGLCTLILTPVFTIIGMMILTGIFHLIAKLFGGNGTWGDLVFCIAAVVAPASVISGVVGIFGGIFSQVRVFFFLVAIIFGIIAVALAIYNIILYVLAIRASENVGTGGAIATLLIPIGVVIVLGFCCGITAIIPTLITTSR